MKISNIKKGKSQFSFVLEDVGAGFANSLRRIMISEVPTMAIEEVTFFENSSALYNEIVAHRLGLVPIKTDLRGFKLPSECTCKGKGCSRCRAVFTLVKKGPGMVYSKDLKSKASKVDVANPDVPVVKLFENQSIKLEANAVLGLGKEHVKWQPGVISYKYYPEIKLNGAGKEVVDACPKNVFSLQGNKAVVKNLENCSLCMACVEVAKNKVEIKGIKNKFMFVIESDGSLKPEQIVAEAANILGGKAKEFEKLLK